MSSVINCFVDNLLLPEVAVLVIIAPFKVVVSPTVISMPLAPTWIPAC